MDGGRPGQRGRRGAQPHERRGRLGAAPAHDGVRPRHGAGHQGRQRRAGIRVHRSATLDRDETTTHRAIPITDPARTIIDLAATLKGRPLEQALDRAEQRGLVDFAWRDARMIVEVDGYRYHRSPSATPS